MGYTSSYDAQDDENTSDRIEQEMTGPVEPTAEGRPEKDEVPTDWSDESMWARASKAGPARLSPLFEPPTETISLSPQQAQRCLAAQLAVNMLKTDGKPFTSGHSPSAEEVISLAEWIMAKGVQSVEVPLPVIP